MTEKLFMLIAYAGFGLMLALWPLAARKSSTNASEVPVLDSKKDTSKFLLLLGVLCGLLVASVLPWWRHSGGFGLAVSKSEMVKVSLVAAVFVVIFLRSALQANADARPSKKAVALQHAVFLASVAFLSFSNLTYADRDVMYSAWHHWGAYIGPSELVLAGARIFRDFPPQYGLGPTLSIAATCGKNCWVGTYYFVSTFTMLFALGIATVAIRTTQPKRFVVRAAVYLLCIACCFFWSSFPIAASSPTVYPSVTGMRFLPVLALALLIMELDRDTTSPRYWIGHLAWACAALWSIESAFYATCIWWPIFILMRQAHEPSAMLSTLLRSTLILVGNLGVLSVGFLLVYWGIYDTTPTIQGMFSYILSPPGPMPINVKGTIWFFAVALALATWVNWKTFNKAGNTTALRQGLLISLLAYSTFSYFVGRSHDNNILNLLPFILLMLLHSWVHAAPFGKGLVAGMLACLLAWLCVFSWVSWKAGLRTNPIAWFDSMWISRALPFDGVQAIYPTETLEVIARSQRLVPEPVTVFGPFENLSSLESNAVWNVFHSPANLIVFPSAARRDFMRTGAATLQRSGWLVVQLSRGDARLLLDDFDSVYARTQEFAMHGYLAVHYAPRKQ